jgi:hypothetical protein
LPSISPWICSIPFSIPGFEHNWGQRDDEPRRR